MKTEGEIKLAFQYSSDKELEAEINLYNHLLSELSEKELIDELTISITVYKKEI